MILKFEDIKVKKRLLIHGGNIDLVDMGINVVIGQSGIGKTSLIRYLFNHYHDDVVYVEQSSIFLNYRLNVLKNISMSDDDKYNEIICNKIFDINLSWLLDKKIKTLSGGEQRLVCFLRGYFSEANLVIIDEPTNDLDYTSVNIIRNLMQENCNSKTYLVVSHDDRIKKIADRLFVIEEHHLNEIAIENIEGLKVNEASQKQDKRIANDSKFMKLFFRFDIVHLLLYLLLALLFCSQLNSYKMLLDDERNRACEFGSGQIIIKHLYVTSMVCDTPLLYYDLNLYFNPISQYQYIKRINNLTKVDFVDLKDIINNDEFNFIPSIVYDIRSKEPRYLFDEIIYNKYGTSFSSDDIRIVDIGDAYFVSFISNDDEYTIDKDDVFELYDEYKNKGFSLVGVTIPTNVYEDRQKFYNSDLFGLLANKFYSGHAQELYDSQVEARLLVVTINTLEYIIISSLQIIFIAFVYITIKHKSEQNNMRILYDYGYELEEIYPIAKKLTYFRFPYLLISLSVMIYNFYILKEYEFALSNYYFLIAYFFISSLLYSIYTFAFRKLLERDFK